VPWLKRAADITSLAASQRRLLITHHAIKPGVRWYCTCSLEPEEGTTWSPICWRASKACGGADRSRGGLWRNRLINQDGDLRTLPCHFPLLIAFRRRRWFTRRGLKTLEFMT